MREYYRRPGVHERWLERASRAYRELRTDPAFVESERERGREKHKRLGYNERYRGKSRKYQAQYRDRWPEKHRAKQAVNNAIRDGRLVRPKHCQECGATGKIHGHHPDYSKPLEVMWLCVQCHGLQHRKESA